MIYLLSLGMVALGWMESRGPAAGPSFALRAPAGKQEKDAAEKIVLDLGGGVKMEFVNIKGGTFTMGSERYFDERPPHEVTITKDYWMQTTETTQGQWEAVMGKSPSRFKGLDLPVERVSWEDCQEFVQKLNEKVKDQLRGKTAALPTEAQWEYACRAGGKGKWCFGDDEKHLSDYAWTRENSGRKTHPVGQQKPNAWGLYDMYGNVWEWCEDWFGKYSADAVTDPTGPAQGKYRIRRGACFGSVAGWANATLRGEFVPTDSGDHIGLRPVLR